MYNRSNIMKRAWVIFKSTKITVFAEALKKAWKEAKELIGRVRYNIPSWFMNKNLDKVTTKHCMCYQTFGPENIVKETKKAILVELDMMTNSGYETYYSKKVWVPKSIIEEYYI